MNCLTVNEPRRKRSDLLVSARLRVAGLRKVLVEDLRGVTRSSIGVERVLRDRTGVYPADPAIQALRCSSALGIKREEPKSCLAGRLFNRVHQPSAQTSTSTATMHDQLCDLAAMWLIRRPGRVKLPRPHDPAAVGSHEKDRTRVRCLNH